MAVFLAFQCPARGHRVQGGPPGRRMRSAAPTLDPVTTHLGSAPTSRRGRAVVSLERRGSKTTGRGVKLRHPSLMLTS
jgi:hypothetical protein